ncbi:paraquat-inducible protein A [Bdellovibrio sp. HCB209]|uniref:paraquat-inducible protein A n=1 Tax=Bdellovibrio sp. HCB209 TaxID=3394354 RepID=UPI0039B53D19
MSTERCRICGEALPTPEGKLPVVVCDTCGTLNRLDKNTSNQASFAYALTALVLYLPANIFPFMTLEVYGNKTTATIWEGIVTLSRAGSWGIALIVFLASILIPFLKLIILFYLSLTAHNTSHRRFKTRLYEIVEVIGRWSMLDIFLLAVLVSIMKLGPWAHAEPGMGSWIFALVVIFTMLSSAYFDPSKIWEKSNDKET